MKAKLQTLSYVVLQGLAKKNGIKANQKAEILIDELVLALTPKEEKKEDISTINNSSTWANITGGNRKENKAYSDAQVYPMSDGMKKWIKDIAVRHNFTAEQIAEMDGWSKAQASEFIEEWQYKPLPASPKQLELIKTTVAEIRETAQRPNMPKEVAKYAKFNVPDAVLESLTGGREGSAGALIDKLFAINKELRPYRPLSEKQADMIVPWFLCPDVSFEDYGVDKHVRQVNKETGEITRRLMTPTEFKEEIMKKFTASDASFFIDQYMPVVRNWERTRITDAQIKHIRELESRMADLSVGTVKEWAYNPDTGNMEEVYQKRVRQYNPIAYEMLPEEHLRQMSRTDADKHITQLKIELGRPTGGSIENSQSQQLLEDKQQKYKSDADEYQEIIDFTYKLDAMCSFSNDELREEITETLVHGNGVASGFTKKLIDYIDMAIDSEAIGFKNLVEIASTSEVITLILEQNYPLEYEEAVGGKRPEDKSKPQQKQAVSEEVQKFLNSL